MKFPYKKPSGLPLAGNQKESGGRRRFFVYFISIFSAGGAAFLLSFFIQIWLFSPAEANIWQKPQRQAVFVELFTSQGCSSCPPADKVLRRLLKEGSVDGVQVVAIGEHVDYWNRLGWKDPFSSAQFSRRQSEYARFWNSSSIYTPQMVVDGRYQFVGSSYSRALAAIKQAAGHRAAAKIGLSFKSTEQRRQPSRSDDGSSNGNGSSHAVADSAVDSFADPTVALQVTVQPYKKISAARLYVAVAERDLVTNVRSGENAGRQLKYGSVLRLLKPVTDLEIEKEATFSSQIELKRQWKRKNLLYISFAQSLQDGHIIAIGTESPSNSQ